MKLLLDTHVLIWLLTDPRTLPALAEKEREIDELWVSAASIWEIEVKRAVGKLSAPEDIVYQLGVIGARDLPITTTHAVAAGRLPLHHADPFDRMLIAQAQVEGLTLVTRDKAMQAYQLPLLWV